MLWPKRVFSVCVFALLFSGNFSPLQIANFIVSGLSILKLVPQVVAAHIFHVDWALQCWTGCGKPGASSKDKMKLKITLGVIHIC